MGSAILGDPAPSLSLGFPGIGIIGPPVVSLPIRGNCRNGVGTIHHGDSMTTRPGYTKQIGIRCDPETVDRCLIAGAGQGEVAGARLLMELGWQAFCGMTPAQLSIAERLRQLAAEIERGQG